MNRLVVAAASAAVVFCSCDVRAKTVALWPFENGNLRCAIDPRYDLLSSSISYADQTIGWNLPPNADSNVTDAATYLFDPVSRGEVKYGNGNCCIYSRSAHFLNLFDSTCGKDFTIEGYFRLSELPAEGSGNGKIFLVCLSGTGNGSGGFVVVLRNKAGLDTNSCHFDWANNNQTKMFGTCTAEQTVSLTNSWNHFALVFKYQGEVAGKSDWTFYLNGKSLGTIQYRYAGAAKPGDGNTFVIGRHQTSTGDRTCLGRYDYWRVSDEALTPDQFLNYDPEGKGGTLVPEPPPVRPEQTVAYWKFNAKDGKVDIRDYVGQAHLSTCNSHVSGANAATAMMLPSDASAFEGNPPNKTVTFPTGNHGSFLAQTTKLSYMSVSNNFLGATLDLTNSFTVEGWFKPDRRSGKEFHASQAWMIGNMSSANSRGWTMGVVTRDGRRRLGLFAFNCTGKSAEAIVNTGDFDACSFCDVTDWGDEWRHLAMTYDPAGGDRHFGAWTLYMNGTLAGTVENIAAVEDAASGKAATKFFIGGTFNGTFAGCYDAVRVSQGMLTPKQFLCYGGDDAEEATGVIATWPLNVTDNSVGLGGANLEGGYNLFNRGTDFPEGIRLLASDETKQPNETLPNPDRSLAFDGGWAARSDNAGSVKFIPGGSKDYAYVATCDPTVLEAFKSDEGWTMEGWFNDNAHSSIQSGGFGMLWGLANDVNDQNSWGFQVVVCQKNSGVRVNGNLNVAPGTFSGAGEFVVGKVNDSKWHHFACVLSYFTGEDDAAMARLKIYIDGIETNVVEGAKGKRTNASWLVFGSNGNGSRGWPGLVNSWRLSRGQLDPSEFLCASAETPVPPETEKKALAYWPLDRNGDGSLNVETKAGVPGYVLSVSDSVSATNGDIVASTDRARGSVPNKDVPFDRTNVGSLAMTDAYLRADYLGARLDLDTAWTVEGWIRPDADGGTEVRTIMGTYVEEMGPYGWKLMMQPGTVGPAFSLRAQPAGCTPMAEGTFVRAANSPAAWVDGGWNHLALEFDPNEGRGTWTLYLNGQAYGSIENSWRNLTLKAKGTFFQFGTYQDDATPSFFGGYDMWRVSTGLLTPEEMLYRDQLGLMLFLR